MNRQLNLDETDLWDLLHQHPGHLNHCLHQVELWEDGDMEREGIATNIRLLCEGYTDTLFASVRIRHVRWEKLADHFVRAYRTGAHAKLNPPIPSPRAADPVTETGGERWEPA